MEGRLPPHNLEAEVATLGSVLLDASTVPKVMEFVRPDDFYRKAHGSIFDAVLSLWDRGESIDLITLTNELQSGGILERVGGASYISSLTTAVPTSANVEYYAQIVRQTALRRRLITIAAELTESCFDDTIPTRQLLEDAERRIFELAETNQTQSFQPAKEVVRRTISAIEKLYHNQDAYTGIPSGLSDLDSMTSGFQASEFIVIGARPSVGKTALALSMAAHMSIGQNIPVGFFTLEMSDMALMQRLVASEARIGSQTIRTGMLRSSDFANLTHAAGRLYDAPLWISDSPGMRLLDLRAQARRMVGQHGVKAIFVDYITLITNENRELARHEQIAEISRSLKALARELDVPVIALSQVSRDTEGKRPMLSSIRESGSIEQDADVVIFLHRERNLEESSTENMNVIKTELIVAKQRNGPVGTIEIAFVPRYTKFENLADDMK
ncbi:replicative DNA helicase [Alkalispirochaeta sphaeroplastigenens]|uniref:Replicative DNA helicase n=1 Tax=Alkalispirochaeta sphaeroplastigenens TaxID=1187066 RepID=A0A2S4JFG8_9SPIO|nr:replicative DNA helicase [Alkalispirochaeta sphaeroplastigenens]POQ98308.1 replicative DNA helicase [Alkalispirochaeta sphaeroplastigenens]